MLKSGKSKLHLTALALVASVFWAPAASAQDAGTLTGVIKDAAGAPVEGAFVQMKNAQRRLNFMVITQAGGKFSNARLPAGNYVVQAIGGEQQSAPSAPVEVAAGKSASVDLALTLARAPALPPAWPGRQPGDRGEEADAAAAGAGSRLPDGAGKAIIEAKCTVCHDTQRIVRSHGEPARWQQVIGTMKLYMQGSTLAKPITEDEEKVLLAYVSSNFGPLPGGPKPKPDPFSRLPRTLLPAEARNYMVVEYELPNPRAEPHEVAVDPSGNGWVTQRVGGKLGKLDVATLNYIEYAPPPAASASVRLNAIRRGNQGEFWMVDGGPNRRWLSFDPKTEQFQSFNLPPTTSGSASGNTMRVHPNNTVWLASIAANQVIRFDPATKQFTFFDVPAGVTAHKNATPYGMAVDGGGNVWVVENAVNQIARIDPKSGAVRGVPAAGQGPGRAQARRRLERQPVGRPARRRRALAGRLQDPEDDGVHAADQGCRRLHGGSGHEQSHDLDEPAARRQDRPARSGDRRVGRVPADVGGDRRAPHRGRSEQSQADLVLGRAVEPDRLHRDAAIAPLAFAMRIRRAGTTRAPLHSNNVARACRLNQSRPASTRAIC